MKNMELFRENDCGRAPEGADEIEHKILSKMSPFEAQNSVERMAKMIKLFRENDARRSPQCAAEEILHNISWKTSPLKVI